MTDSNPTVFLLGDDRDAKPVQVHQCQKKWDDLRALGHDDVRYCDDCKQTVHRVIDIQGFERAVAQARCVMAEGRNADDGARANFVGKADASSYQLTSMKLTWED